METKVFFYFVFFIQDLTLFIRTPKITFFLLKHAVDANALLTLYTVTRLPQQSAQSFRQASSCQFDIRMTPLVGNQGVIFNACHFYSSMCKILDIFVEQIMLRKINLNVSQWNITNYWSETLPTCCGRGLWGGGGGRCVHMDTIMMVRATKWVCRKNLWDETTINLAWYDSDGNGEGDVGTIDEGWRSRRDDDNDNNFDDNHD